jgi:hypothetical protein
MTDREQLCREESCGLVFEGGKEMTSKELDLIEEGKKRWKNQSALKNWNLSVCLRMLPLL